MAIQISHLGTRMLWLALGAGPGIYHLIEGISTNSLGRALEGCGMILMGGACFLQAGFIGSKPRGGSKPVEDRAIGTPGWRNGLSLIGGSFILLGLLLGFGFNL
jgi:hypothetical protein